MWEIFLLGLKRRLRRPGQMALLIAPVLLCLLACLWLRGREEPGTPQIGVALAAPSARGDRLLANLTEGGDGALRFVALEPEELERRVAAGTLDCGYLIPADFDERAASGRWRGCLVRYTSPASSLAAVADEAVAAAVLETCWADIAARALPQRGDAPSAEALLQNAALACPMEIQVEALEGAAAGESAPTMEAAVLRGGVAIALLLYALLCAGDVAADLNGLFFRRARPAGSGLSLALPTLLAALLPGLFGAGAALLVCGVLLPGFSAGPVRELLPLAAYGVYLAGMVTLAAALAPRRGVHPALLPFVLIACLLLCPVLFDASGLLPALGPLSLLLPPHALPAGRAGAGFLRRGHAFGRRRAAGRLRPPLGPPPPDGVKTAKGSPRNPGFEAVLFCCAAA